MPESLDSLTVSHDTALALQSAGFPQDTVLNWYRHTKDDDALWVLDWCPHGWERVCAAPTFSEIWAQLPTRPQLELVDSEGEPTGDVVEGEIEVHRTVRPCVKLLWDQRGFTDRVECRDTLTEAAAAFYLSLVHSGHIVPTERGEG